MEGVENEKEDDYYVKISVVDADNRVYRWSPRKGKSWTLTQNQNSSDKLVVGTECPHYNQGHTEATLIYEEGNLVAILGTNGKRYSKEERYEDQYLKMKDDVKEDDGKFTTEE